MKKKGISPLIATVLLIGATIALAALVMIWAQNLFQETTEETGAGIKAEIICSSEVQFSIDSAVDDGTKIITRVTSNGDRDIKKFIVRVYDNSDPPNIEIGEGADDDKLVAYGSEEYDISGYTIAPAKIEMIPVIELDDGSLKTCRQNTVTRDVKAP